MQVVYRSDLVDDRQTAGATGDLTIEETLTQLLSGTGLTFQYLEDKGVTIVPLARSGAAATAPTAQTGTQDKSFGSKLRLAAADQGEARREGVSSPPADIAEVVVSARRVNEKLQDIPLAVTAIGQESLERRGITELRDLESLAPSLVIKEHNNNSGAMVASLRGQSSAGIHLTIDSAVGMYVDGINIPRTNGLRSALVDVARVEVLRGPQGTLYGRNTTGGAISIVTNDPTDRIEGSGKLTLGNYDAMNVEGTLNVPISDSVAARFVAQKGTRDGFGVDGSGNDRADEDSLYLRGKIGAEVGRVKMKASVSHSELDASAGMPYITGVVPGLSLAVRQIAAELGLPLLAPDLPTYRVGPPATPAALQTAIDTLTSYRGRQGSSPFRTGETASAFTRYRGTLFTGDVEMELSDALSGRWLTGYSTENRNNSDGADGTPYAIYFGDFESDADYFSQELHLIGSFDRLKFVAGAYYSYEDGFERFDGLAAPAVLINSASLFRGDVTNQNTSAFGQFDFDLTDKWTFTGGLRYTFEKRRLVSYNTSTGGCRIPVELRDSPPVCQGTFDKDDSDPSWLASLSYHVTPDVMLYGRSARGFRAGGLNFRAAGLAPAFAPFDPERVDEYEIGLKSTLFDRKLILNLAAYHADYDGAQRTIIVLSDGRPATQVSNAASATINGFDLEATIRPIRNVEFSAVVGYLDPKYESFIDSTGDRTGEDFPAAEWTYAFSGRYSVPLSEGDLSFQLDYAGQGKQNLAPGGRRPLDSTQEAYGLLNARIAYDFAAGYELSIWGRNLTDKEYMSGALATDGSLGLNLGFAGAPRTFGAELRVTF